MIKFSQFPPLWDLPSGSPFCAKIETYLRMVGLPYETVNDADVRKAPRKLPVIQDDTRRIADSGLKERYYARPNFLIFAVLSLAPWLGTARAADWVGPIEGERFESRSLEALLKANPLAPKENIRAVPLSKGEQSHHVLVQVREREPLHLHADSDITVFLVKGRGKIRLGDRQLPVKVGDVIHIPRGTIHAFINEGREPAAALVVYSPAPGPEDRVLIRE